MDQIKALRVLVRVADMGSMAAASRAMDLSAAAVTRLVADLEDELGVRLLHRSTRRLTLTDVGEAYIERARRVLQEFDEAASLARSVTADVEGCVRVLAPPAFAVHQLVRHLPHFYGLHPKVAVELAIQDHVHAVDDAYDVTIIVTGAVELQGDFIARPLARAELVVCATPGYFKCHGKPMHPLEIERHEVVLPPVAQARREFPFHPRERSDAERSWEPVFARPRAPRMASMHLDAIQAAVMNGVGIGALPSFVVADALQAGVLERVLPEWYLLAHSIYAGMPTRKHVPVRTRAFVDFLVQSFGGHGAADPWLAEMGDHHARAPSDIKGRLGFGLSRTPS